MGRAGIVWLVAAVSYLALIAATLWLLSLDTLAQANWIYPGTLVVLFTGIFIVTFAVRRYRRLDELTQRVHLIALAVAFVGTLLLVFVWTVFEVFGLVDDLRIVRFIASPGPYGPLGLWVLGVMLAFYLVGWVWGRSLYR